MKLKLDRLTQQAVKHAYHCLIGCGIGEIIGMSISSALRWGRLERVSVAIVLAFALGFSFTYVGVRKQTKSVTEAMKITIATDTISIVSMEVIDSLIEFLIPNALIVTPTSFRFWWGLAVSLGFAFVVTIPVNRYTMQHQTHMHHH